MIFRKSPTYERVFYFLCIHIKVKQQYLLKLISDQQKNVILVLKFIPEMPFKIKRASF